MTMQEYLSSKANFISKHFGERGFREDGGVVGEKIHKVLVFEDGAQWYEITEPIWEKLSGTLHGIPVETKVRMYRTEFWDSDNSKSRYLYESA